MQRTVASFALATLSLLVSYIIVAAWPDPPDGRGVAGTASVAAETTQTPPGLAN
jgi:hypothetical protein